MLKENVNHEMPRVCLETLGLGGWPCTMNGMNQLMAFAAILMTLVLAFAGCSRLTGTPTRSIEVPEGGPPVLTTAERLARETDAGRPPAQFVSQAAYMRPIGQPGPLKPFEQWTEQDAATDALGRIGAAAVPALVDALRSGDPAMREKALEVLGRIGPDAEAAVPDLVQLLDDPDPAVRKSATRTLGRIGPAAEGAVPALMRSLLTPVGPTPQ